MANRCTKKNKYWYPLVFNIISKLNESNICFLYLILSTKQISDAWDSIEESY